jgi:hypothetical protein
MATTEEYLARYVAAAAAHLDEPIAAVGMCSRPGSMGNAMAYQVSPLWAMLRDRKAKQASGGLPRNILVAVTPTRLVAFEYRPKGTGIKLKDRCGEWPRAGLVVQADAPGTLTQRIRLDWPDGTTLELDASRGIGKHADLNGPFLAALGVPAIAA